MRMAHAFPLPPARCEVNRRYRPSGDQRDRLLSVPGDVRRLGSPPVVDTIQTSLCRLLSDSRTVVSVNATRSPEGDMAGDAIVPLRDRSVGWKRRGACSGM